MSKQHILYIEDYPVIQTLYTDVLKKNGYVVDSVSDGKEALEKLKKHKYDLVLLDLLLPHVTGVEFLQEYTKDHSPETVIVLTDFDKPETVERVKAFGVKHYWIKVENTPFLLAQRLDHLFSGKAED